MGFNAVNASILTLAIFGSQIRGDADNLSDVDILIVTDSGKPDTKVVSKYIGDNFSQNGDFSIYSLSRLKEMYNSGHLFAWHLFRESKHIPYLDTKNLIFELGKPQPYKNANQDIAELINVLETIEAGLSNVYEAGLLYVCLRNIAISASWHSELGLKFGRRAPFELGEAMPKFPLKASEYDLLAACRHATTRGKPCPDINDLSLLDYLKRGHNWALKIHEWIGNNSYVE